jgi:hypothetical protein
VHIDGKTGRASDLGFGKMRIRGWYKRVGLLYDADQNGLHTVAHTMSEVRASDPARKG